MTLPMPDGQLARQWQIDASEALRAGFRAGYKNCLVSAATGTGKGSLIAGIAIAAANRGHRVLMLAHRDELVSELPDRIRKVRGAPRTGIVMAERDQPDAPIVCASVQSTTSARRAKMGRFDLILTDEAHHATAPSYQDVYRWVRDHNPEALHAGFTATPFRSGANGETRGLGTAFDALVFEYGIRQAIAAGDLVPVRGWNISTEVDLSVVETTRFGDFDEAQLAKAVDTPARNRVILDQYLERAPGLPGLVFAASVEHAKHIAEVFRAAGVRAEAVWGEMPKEARRSLVDRFRRQDGIDILVSRDLLFEGFDAPAIRILLKARPTTSRIVFQQLVGRGLRLYPGKTECLFVDLVDNGCELDLATLADLSDDGETESKARVTTLDEGDYVRRRHHEDWGIGVVQEVHLEELPRATVQWPRSRFDPAGRVLVHPWAELIKVPASEVDRPVQLSIRPTSLRVRAYEIFLLPKEEGAHSVGGWYRYHAAHSVSGQRPDGTRATVLVEAGTVWEVAHHPDAPVPADRVKVRCLREGLDEADSLAWATAHLASLQLVADDHGQSWRVDPCTPAQTSALTSFGIRRDFTRMARGEAGVLLDTVAALRRIREAQQGAAQAKRAQTHRRRMSVLNRKTA